MPKKETLIVKEETDLDIYRIICEPGDMTRYDFFVIPYFDDFLIFPCESEFKFPQRLNKFDIFNQKGFFNTFNYSNVEDRVKMAEIAKEIYPAYEGINLNTIYQVARAINKVFLKEGK